jgi:cobalt-zinc-cadmium resistance protein CzcA
MPRLVLERLPELREAIPEEMATPEMGPITTGLGEIYQFKVTGSGRSLMELRSILDWEIAPKLRTVPGVIEVNSHGGQLKTYEVQVDSDKLMAYRIRLAAGGARQEQRERWWRLYRTGRATIIDTRGSSHHKSGGH